MIESPLLPQARFSAPMPDQGDQIALMTTMSPFRELAVLAVPFGKASNIDNLPLAAAGSSAVYRSKLHVVRGQQKGYVIGAPVVTLFGKQVQGEAHSLVLPLHGTTYEPAVLIEWVTEVGQREWVVRITVEQRVAAAASRGV